MNRSLFDKGFEVIGPIAHPDVGTRFTAARQKLGDLRDRLQNTYPEDRLIVDITGGTKILSFAALSEFGKEAERIQYVDGASGQVISLAKDSEPQPYTFRDLGLTLDDWIKFSKAFPHNFEELPWLGSPDASLITFSPSLKIYGHPDLSLIAAARLFETYVEVTAGFALQHWQMLFNDTGDGAPIKNSTVARRLAFELNRFCGAFGKAQVRLPSEHEVGANLNTYDAFVDTLIGSGIDVEIAGEWWEANDPQPLQLDPGQNDGAALVCLLGDEPIPVVTALHHFEAKTGHFPATLQLVTTNEKRAVVQRLAAYARRLTPPSSVEAKFIDSTTDLKGLTQVLSDIPNCEMVSITGGTTLMSLHTFLHYLPSDQSIIYSSADSVEVLR